MFHLLKLIKLTQRCSIRMTNDLNSSTILTCCCKRFFHQRANLSLNVLKCFEKASVNPSLKNWRIWNQWEDEIVDPIWQVVRALKEHHNSIIDSANVATSLAFQKTVLNVTGDINLFASNFAPSTIPLFNRRILFLF